MSKTQLIVKLATQDIIPVQSRFQDSPPTIILEFPTGRVAGALPERSVIRKGVIQEIRTAYASTTDPAQTRWIQALEVRLRGLYTHRVLAEPGRIVVEIEHPDTVATEGVQIGLAEGVVVSGSPAPAFSERFRAMQKALMQAGPKPLVWSVSFQEAVGRTARERERQMTRGRSPREPTPSSRRRWRQAERSGTTARPDPVAATPLQASEPAPTDSGTPIIVWLWMIAALSVGAGIVWWLSSRESRRPAAQRPRIDEPMPQSSSGMRLIDQLVWRAFEQQGYQLLQTVELGDSRGLLRVISKDAFKAALLCVGEGAFFEKGTVERLLQTMRQVSVEQGFLVAPGSFTVPAQRFAKEHRVTLIGRDQLMELLSAGAINEHYTKQLQQAHSQLEEAKETLSQYARQLDLIRRQRNEASWFLGEERTKRAKLEEQAAELTQQIGQWQAQAQQWKQAAEEHQKRWEESEWYLGEARASARHLDEQLEALRTALAQAEDRSRELTVKLQDVERQRDEANWFLGEARAAQAAMQQEVEPLEQAIRQLQQELEATRRAVDERHQHLEAERMGRQSLEAELAAVRAHGERRRARRLVRAGVTIELQSFAGLSLFRGTPRDLSRTGFGLASADSLTLPDSVQVRLCLPGVERPIESPSRLVWQRQDPLSRQYHIGGEFVDVSTETREVVEQALIQTP